MALNRKHQWEVLHFHPFLIQRASVPFAWGSNDCATFAADGVMAMTGVDIMSDLRGYRSQTGALKKIRHATGGKSLEEAVVWCATKHGLKEREHVLKAQRGDLVLYRNADGSLAAGLVHLNGDVASPGETGLLRMPLNSVHRAWTY